MSKQLRIWLFLLLGTLLTSSSLLAENVITMTTTRESGDEIDLRIVADGDVLIDGVRENARTDGRIKWYTLYSQTITIRGDVMCLDCWGNELTSLDVSGCSSLSELKCNGNQLTSLNLSSCTALTELSCWNNKLTSLDVSGCTALTTLSCYENPLTSINLSGCQSLKDFWWTEGRLTSLDVSGCTALTELYCNRNQLTSLDVSGCTALTELWCFENQLTSLDVSGCTSLTELWCNENQLTSLDVSDCTALTWLNCDKNQLTSLNLSGCTALTTLSCYENPLTSINLSGCQSLKEFRWTRDKLTSLDVSGCTALTELWCYENQLTSLNVSGCTALTWLDCQKNQLTSLDVSGCTALTTLGCWENQLTSLDVSGCTALTKLSCDKNQLTSLDVSGCTALTELYCYNNEIKGTEMTNLVNSLPDRQGAEEGAFHVFREVKHGDVDVDVDVDGNVCLAAHVATAKAKNWRTLFYRDDKSHDYAGLDKPTFVVTYSSSNGGSISITGSDDLQNVPYGTELTIVATPVAGYKLTALTANGEDILATKKVVIKGATEVKATFADNTGVETTVTQQVKLYPNPATDYVIVEGVAPASEVTLHSMTGERLYAGRADGRGTLQIDLTPYADGVYLVCVAGETYRVVVRR